MSSFNLMKKIGKVAKQKYPCVKCNKEFSTKFSMQRHHRECGVAPNRVECKKCKKSLKNTEILEKHQQICFGLSKKVVCRFCDELFSSQFSLRRHLWRFHQNEELLVQTTKQNQKAEMKYATKIYNNVTKKKNQATEKKILNFTLQKTEAEEKDDFCYYLDVCYDEDYLEEECTTMDFEKAIIYPQMKIKK